MRLQVQVLRILTLLLLGFAGAVCTQAQKFKRIENIEELTNGRRFIIVRDEDGDNDFAFAYLDGTYGKKVSVTVVDDIVEISASDPQPLIFTWAVEDGKNYIKLDSETYFYAYSSYAGGFLTNTYRATNYDWTVSIASSTNTELTCKNYSTAAIKYTSYGDFRCYKSGKTVALYLETDVATGIDAVKTDKLVSKYFNLKGQFCGTDYDKLPFGIYIVNGRKILKP